LTCGLRPKDLQRKILEEHMDTASDGESRGKIEDSSSRKFSGPMSRTVSRYFSVDVVVEYAEIVSE